MTRRRFAWSAAVLAGVLVLAGAEPLIAARPYWEGRPAFRPGASRGYFIWNDDDGWHVRWTTRGGRHVFSGTVSCDGAFTNFSAYDKERRDFIKKISASAIRFDAAAEGGVDGFDFRLSPSARQITFDLKFDGVTASPDDVKIGRDKERPPRVPFTIDRGPRGPKNR